MSVSERIANILCVNEREYCILKGCNLVKIFILKLSYLEVYLFLKIIKVWPTVKIVQAK